MSIWKKIRLAGIFGLSIFLGINSLEDEARNFRLTAPTEMLVTYSVEVLARKFQPDEEMKVYISLAIPQTRN